MKRLGLLRLDSFWTDLLCFTNGKTEYLRRIFDTSDEETRIKLSSSPCPDEKSRPQTEANHVTFVQSLWATVNFLE